ERVEIAVAEGTETPAERVASPTLSKEATQVAREAVPTITIEDFAKLDLRVVRVISAERVHGTDKLMKLEVDMGGEKRTVVAAIAQEFTPDEMIDKLLVLVANLAPARIRGIVSQGMILAAGDEKPLALVTLDREVPPGTKVR
ncbi:MAG TPA: methionine--tRNA ligase subunit beta, partial [Armatimonadetes bacterium]|nr:methionine--tRNA ligase subunit beta [Armatimonadota bacterium]